MLNIALPKGRLGEKVYDMFEKAGYDCQSIHEKNRKLLFENPEKGICFFWVKPSDVNIYVERGAADIGVAGKAMRRLPPPIDSFKVIVAKKFVNVASKVRTVMRKLWSGKKVSFLNLFEGAQSKSDIVATFLAVLELEKTKKISIDGDMKNPSVQMINEVDTVE